MSLKRVSNYQLSIDNYQLPEGYKQTEVGVIPEDWELVSIGDVGSVSSGGTPSRTNLSYWNGTIPWITTTQIDFNTIDSAEQFITKDGLNNSAAKLFPSGTLLMAMYGQGKTRGKVAILSIEASTNQACAAISLSTGVNQNYVFHYLISQYESIRNLSNTGNQENLNGLIIKSIKVPIPPLSEQRSIAQALSDVDRLIAALEKAIAKKRAIKTATMQQLLTGKKRLPGFGEGKGYQKTEVGLIPEDWDICTIKETMNLINGCAFKPKDWKTEGIPIIRIQNLNDPTASYNYYDAEVDEKYYVNPGDILFAWSGTKESSFGARIWWGERAILNQHIFRVVPNLGKLTSHYTLLALRRFQEDIEKKSHGFKSSFVHVKKSDLEGTELAIPSLPEQHAIATVLSDMDAETDALETRLAKTQSIKQGMMQELLTGRTRLI